MTEIERNYQQFWLNGVHRNGEDIPIIPNEKVSGGVFRALQRKPRPTQPICYVTLKQTNLII